MAGRRESEPATSCSVRGVNQPPNGAYSFVRGMLCLNVSKAVVSSTVTTSLAPQNKHPVFLSDDKRNTNNLICSKNIGGRNAPNCRACTSGHKV